MSVPGSSSGAAPVCAGVPARSVATAAVGVDDSQLPVASPCASEEEMAGLPDLAGPSEFAGALGSGLPDPMAVDGVSDVEALRESLLRDITAAGARGKEPLAGDWSNFWKCAPAVSKVFDLHAIWERTRSEEQAQQLCVDWFTRLVSAEADSWDLGSTAPLLAEVPHGSLWSRPLTQVFHFLGKSFSLAPHAVAQSFEDNHLALVHKTFRMSEDGGEITFPVARWSLLVANSGAGKSPLMGLVQKVLKAPAVQASFGSARSAWLQPLERYSWYSAQGSNLEGILAHAAKDNDPVGLRRVHDEISQTIASVGGSDGDKIRPSQVILLANPQLDAGKRLKGSAVCVPDLKITLTAAVQGNLCFKFLPFTPEGESARWVPVVSPVSLGLDLARSEKLSNKRASTDVLVKLLSVHVLKLLDRMTDGSVLRVCDSARACAQYLEGGPSRLWLALPGGLGRRWPLRILCTPSCSASWMVSSCIIWPLPGLWGSLCWLG